MMGCNPFAVTKPAGRAAIESNPVAAKLSLFAGKAKRVIYLHMAGSPSQLELFDYKPDLAKLHAKDCPPSLLEGKKFDFIEGVSKMLSP